MVKADAKAAHVASVRCGRSRYTSRVYLALAALGILFLWSVLPVLIGLSIGIAARIVPGKKWKLRMYRDLAEVLAWADADDELERSMIRREVEAVIQQAWGKADERAAWKKLLSQI